MLRGLSALYPNVGYKVAPTAKHFILFSFLCVLLGCFASYNFKSRLKLVRCIHILLSIPLSLVYNTLILIFYILCQVSHYFSDPTVSFYSFCAIAFQKLQVLQHVIISRRLQLVPMVSPVYLDQPLGVFTPVLRECWLFVSSGGFTDTQDDKL